MSVISWNSLGLGNLCTIPDSKYLTGYYNQAIIFLSETLVHRNKIEEFPNIFGRSGGLALYWHSSIKCQIVDYLNNHITIDILKDGKGIWRLTSYYGYPNGSWR
jgi:hypothetical protein